MKGLEFESRTPKKKNIVIWLRNMLKCVIPTNRTPKHSLLQIQSSNLSATSSLSITTFEQYDDNS